MLLIQQLARGTKEELIEHFSFVLPEQPKTIEEGQCWLAGAIPPIEEQIEEISHNAQRFGGVAYLKAKDLVASTEDLIGSLNIEFMYDKVLVVDPETVADPELSVS